MEGSRPEGHITGPRNKGMEVDGQKIEKSGGVF